MVRLRPLCRLWRGRGVTVLMQVQFGLAVALMGHLAVVLLLSNPKGKGVLGAIGLVGHGVYLWG